MLRPVVLVGLGVVMLGAVACAGGGAASKPGASVTVVMTEFKFEPAEIAVTRGQAVTLSLQNKGTVIHDFVINDLNVRSAKVAVGQNATLTFTPNQSGTFSVICTEPAHEQSGMVAQLKVS